MTNSYFLFKADMLFVLLLRSPSVVWIWKIIIRVGTTIRKQRKKNWNRWMASNYFSCPSNCFDPLLNQTWLIYSIKSHLKMITTVFEKLFMSVCMWASAFNIHSIPLPQSFNSRWPLCLQLRFRQKKSIFPAGMSALLLSFSNNGEYPTTRCLCLGCPQSPSTAIEYRTVRTVHQALVILLHTHHVALSSHTHYKTWLLGSWMLIGW